VSCVVPVGNMERYHVHKLAYESSRLQCISMVSTALLVSMFEDISLLDKESNLTFLGSSSIVTISSLCA
jgi:hypothetical protein